MRLKLPTITRVGFRVWEYRVNHKQLLIRSPKGADSSKNVDVMFCNVQYMDLPSDLPDLEFAKPLRNEIAFAESRMGKTVGNDLVFVLKSGDQRHIVVAGSAAVAENDMDVL